jgi:hypothetical protein
MDDNPSVVCNEDGGTVDGCERVCLLPIDHQEPHDFAVIAGRTSVPDRLKELAALKDGWHDGQGLAIAPEIIERVGKVLAEMPIDLPIPYLFPLLFEQGISVEWNVGFEGWIVGAEFGPPGCPIACTAVRLSDYHAIDIDISKDHAKELTKFLRGLK